MPRPTSTSLGITCGHGIRCILTVSPYREHYLCNHSFNLCTYSTLGVISCLNFTPREGGDEPTLARLGTDGTLRYRGNGGFVISDVTQVNRAAILTIRGKDSRNHRSYPVIHYTIADMTDVVALRDACNTFLAQNNREQEITDDN